MFQEYKTEKSQNMEIKSPYFHFENDITMKTIHVHSFSQQIILQYSRHLPIVCFDNRLEPIPISMKNIGYRPIPIPIPILYKAPCLHTTRLKLMINIAQR